LLGLFLPALLPPAAFAEWGLNMTKGVTPISHSAYALHMTIFYICSGIGAVVFGVMLWSILHHRKSKGAKAAQFQQSTTAELFWTLIPMLILIAMAVPATKSLVVMEDASGATMTIKATGYQWRWHYEYLDEGISFFSNLDAASNEARRLDSGIDPASVENYLLEVDNRVVLPVNRKIRVLTTAADVLHAWWVPALGWKRDSIPGFINESWAYIEEPGIYRGQCAELCGRDHAFMPIVIEAVDEPTYRAWVMEKKREQAAREAAAEKIMTKEDLMSLGEDVYSKMCTACHQPNGQGLPPAFPGLAGGPITTGPLGPHLDQVLNGKSGTAMAAFGPQLNDAELAAVVTYERNAWGNAARLGDGADIVQPADVKAARTQVAGAP